MLTAVSWSPLGRVRLVSVIGRGGERNRAKQAPQSRSTAAARAQRSLLAASVAAASVSNEQLSRAVPAKIGSEWSLTEQPPSLLRLNAICPYFTMFPLDFPLDALAGARPHEWVLDPFCGRGTTLFAARLCGLGAVGVDVNPVATALAAAKLVRIRPETIVRRCRELLRNGYEPIEIPHWRILGYVFSPRHACRPMPPSRATPTCARRRLDRGASRPGSRRPPRSAAEGSAHLSIEPDAADVRDETGRGPALLESS
jgi:hypothetical protein